MRSQNSCAHRRAQAKNQFRWTVRLSFQLNRIDRDVRPSLIVVR